MTLEKEKVPGKLKRKFHKNVRWEDEYGWRWVSLDATETDAEVVSSELIDSKLHAPAIDIDVPAYLIPSGTRGHTHLYIDVPMSWRKYKRLLKAMGKAGVVEPGYVKSSLRRRHTALRVPWKPKGMVL